MPINDDYSTQYSETGKNGLLISERKLINAKIIGKTRLFGVDVDGLIGEMKVKVCLPLILFWRENSTRYTSFLYSRNLDFDVAKMAGNSNALVDLSPDCALFHLETRPQNATESSSEGRFFAANE